MTVIRLVYQQPSEDNGESGKPVTLDVNDILMEDDEEEDGQDGAGNYFGQRARQNFFQLYHRFPASPSACALTSV